MVYKFIVTFELKNKNRKYTSFYKKLETLGSDRRKLFENCWFVKVVPPVETLDISHTGTQWQASRRKEAPKTAKDLFTELYETMSEGDFIYISQLAQHNDHGLLLKDDWPWVMADD